MWAWDGRLKGIREGFWRSLGGHLWGRPIVSIPGCHGFTWRFPCAISPRRVGSEKPEVAVSEVDGEDVPVRHFGVILTLPQWETITAKLQGAQVRFIIEPQVRFRGQPGEQATCFFLDPSGNALELKAFADDAMVFAK